jgi:hypothetical protein
MKLINLAGRVFGRLKVLQRDKSYSRYTKWRCACVCGKVVSVRSHSLLSGDTASCGCLRLEQLVSRSTTHGLSKTAEYRLWFWAKHRAAVAGIPFALEPSDITIPSVCPVFGTPLVARSDGTSGPLPSSPSLDRIDPQFGYTVGNVWVISHRANSIKNGFTLSELEAVVAAVRRRHIAGRGVRLENRRQAVSGIAAKATQRSSTETTP